MLAPVTLFDGPTVTHLLDWDSKKIHRKVRSTLAAEGSGASRAYDRAMFTRALIYEIEAGKDGLHWTEAVRTVPFGIGTDCKSLFDVCTKVGSLPDERRVALDLLDIKEGVEENNDQVRWVPTDHMLADVLTKNMPPDLMMKYLKTGVYSFKYDDEVKNTKRACAKERKDARDLVKAEKVKAEASEPDAPRRRITGKQPPPKPQPQLQNLKQFQTKTTTTTTSTPYGR